jgi:tetratricopeptide (TPR) repeat protein
MIREARGSVSPPAVPLVEHASGAEEAARRPKSVPAPTPRRRIALVLAVALSSMVVPALLLWRSAGSPLSVNHWDAVARGRAYMRAGRPDRAFEAVSGIRDEAPGAAEAMAVAGFALLRMGEYRTARLALDRSITLRPEQFDALVALADINFGLGNGLRGIQLLRHAARLRPGDFRVWFRMGKVQSDLGDLPQAIDAYERAVALKPSDREALTGLIGALTNSFRSGRAAEWVARALETYPDDPVILGYGARASFDANNLREAVALAGRALQADPRNVNALMARASALAAESGWQEALADAERAAAAAPNDRAVLQLLQSIELKLGLKDRAAKTQAQSNVAGERARRMGELSRLIDRHPDNPEYPWKLGEAAREGSMFLLASRCYEAALALDPRFLPAQESLAKLRQEHPELAAGSDALDASSPQVRGAVQSGGLPR